jgi:predicted PurR-regulated permease PerM
LESTAKRHSKAAPASVEKVVVVETEEIHESRRYDVRTAALIVVAILLSLFALRVGAAFFIPLLVSIMLSYALSPAVNRLERWHVPRPFGAALVMVLLIAAGTAAIHRAGADAEALLEQLPRAVEKVRLAVSASQRTAPGPLEHVKRTATELEKLAGAAAPAAPAAPAATPGQPPAIDMRSVLLIGTGSIVIALGQLASVLFLTFFLLGAGDLFRRKLMQLVGPPLARQKTILSILQEIHSLNQRYFAVVVLINVTVGICTGVGLYFLGLEHAELWGLAIAVLHTIPYLGAALVAATVGLAAYLQFGTAQMALLAGGIPVGASIILGIWLQTMLMGRAARMNAASVFISLLFWGMLWGAWGLLLAVPMMVAIKTLCENIEPLKRYGSLLAPAGPAE